MNRSDQKARTVLTPSQMKSRDAFTLIEVLISMMILAVALSGTLFIFTKAGILTSGIKERVVALESAKAEIENIRGMSFDSVLNLGADFTPIGADQLSSATGTRTLTDPFSSDDLRKITVSINWTTPGGRPNSVKLSTNVTREGVNKQ